MIRDIVWIKDIVLGMWCVMGIVEVSEVVFILGLKVFGMDRVMVR